VLLKTAIRDFSVNNSQTSLEQIVPKLRENGGQDLNTAILLLQMLESVYPDLQAELGNYYYEGLGIIRDTNKAFVLFQKAAAKGSIKAHYDLGWYYYDSNEYLRAVEHFSFCVSHKNDFDDYKLSRIYECLGDSYTRLSEPNFTNAIENLLIAADKYHQGYACRRLAIIYKKPGTHYYDPEKAIKYYRLGISYGDLASVNSLAIDYIMGNDDMKIKPNSREAENILLPFAGCNDFDIMHALGLLYMHEHAEIGFEQDLQKAKHYFERAWKLKQNTHLASNLGYVYYCLGDYFNAEEMLIIADNAGNTESSDFLGRIYKDGLLGIADPRKAAYYYGRTYETNTLNNLFTWAEYVEVLESSDEYQKAYDIAGEGLEKYRDAWFLYCQASLVLKGKVVNRVPYEQAAEMMEAYINAYDHHEDDAHMLLGHYYISAREYRKAEHQYLEAFSHGNIDAAINLGRLYETGGGTIPSDINKAYEWYLKAAESGSIVGKNEISCFKKGFFGGYRRIRSL